MLNPVLGLAVNVAVQVACMRWVPGMRLLKSVFYGFGAGILTVLSIELCVQTGVYVFTDHAPLLLVNILTYGALGYCYFHFINLGETARRIRMLRELYEAGRTLTKAELLERYNAKEIVTQRLDRMLGHGQIVEREGRYCIGNPTLLVMAVFMVLMKKLMLGKVSEFD